MIRSLSSPLSRSSELSDGAWSGSFGSLDGGGGGGSCAAAASAREALSWSLGRWKYSKALSKLRLFRLGLGSGEEFGRDMNGDGGEMVGSGSGEEKPRSRGKGSISRGSISSSTSSTEKPWDTSISIGAGGPEARYGLWVKGRSKGEVRLWAEQIGSWLSSAQTRTSDGRYGGKGL